MRVTEVRLRGFEIRKRGFGGVEFAQVTAQDGVDESRLRTEAGLFGLLDGFVNGGVIGNAVEPENLVKAEAQAAFATSASGRGRAFCGRSANPARLASGPPHTPTPGTGRDRPRKDARPRGQH